MPERPERSRISTAVSAPIAALLRPPEIASWPPPCTASAITSATSGSEAGLMTLAMSESRQVRESVFSTMDMHAAKFGAAVQLGENLARIEQQQRIEGTLN